MEGSTDSLKEPEAYHGPDFSVEEIRASGPTHCPTSSGGAPATHGVLLAPFETGPPHLPRLY